MKDYILNTDTKKSLERLLSQPSHAYLFWGPKGLGKTTLANDCAEKLMGSQSQGDRARWILRIARAPEKKNISIAQLKTVAEFLHQKLPEGIQKKVVIIDESESLSIEAANSLLKILEEPPNDSLLILISHNASALPLTIRSRLSSVEFKQPKSEDILQAMGSHAEIKQLLDMYGPKPALLARLSTDQAAYQQSAELYANAKEFYTAQLPGKLAIAAKIAKDKTERQFFDLLGGVVSQSPTASEALIFADKHLYNSGNSRFVLEHLALEFM